MPIIKNTLRAAHQIVYGQPRTPYTIQEGKRIPFAEVGKELFFICDFPQDDLPSGGYTGHLSRSEMVMLWVQMIGYEPLNDSAKVVLYQLQPSGKKAVRIKISTPDHKETLGGANQYSSWDEVVFGRFGNEISEIGTYQIQANYPQGEVVWQFEVR